MDPIVEAFENGDLLNNRYLCLGRINKGSYGIVYLSEDIDTGLKYAIKYVYPTPNSDYDDSKEEAMKEIDIYLKLGNHPNIAQLVDHFDNFLVLEYCERGDLYDLIRCDEGPKTTKDIVDVMIQLIDLIQYCHDKGIYHRDIKPENIFVSQDCQMKLGDWGLATTERYSKQFNIGSDRYMAPELYSKEEDSEFKLSELDDDIPEDYYDASKVDTWALGICFLNIIFHKNPFNQANSKDKIFMNYCNNREVLFDIFPSMSEDLFNVLRNCLNLDPKNRDLIKMKNELMNVDTLTYQFNNYSDEDYDEEDEVATNNNDSHIMSNPQSTSTKESSTSCNNKSSIHENFGKLSLVDPTQEITTHAVSNGNLQIDDLETTLEEEDIKVNQEKNSTVIYPDFNHLKNTSEANSQSPNYNIHSNNDSYEDDMAVGSYEEGPSSFITQPSKPINIKKSYQNHQDRKPLSIQTPNFKKISRANNTINNSNFYKNSYTGNTINNNNKLNTENISDGIYYRNSYSQSFKKFNKRDAHNNKNNGTNKNNRNKNLVDQNKRRFSNHNNSSHNSRSHSNSRKLTNSVKPKDSNSYNNINKGANFSDGGSSSSIPGSSLSKNLAPLTSSLSKLDTKVSAKSSHGNIYIPPNLRDKLKSPANQAKAFTTDVYFSHLGNISSDNISMNFDDDVGDIMSSISKNRAVKVKNDKPEEPKSNNSFTVASTNAIGCNNFENNMKNLLMRRRRASFGGKSMAPTLETIEDVYVPPHHRPNYDGLKKVNMLSSNANKLYSNTNSIQLSKNKKNRNSGDPSSEGNKLKYKKHSGSWKFYSNGFASTSSNKGNYYNTSNNANNVSNSGSGGHMNNSEIGSQVYKAKPQSNKKKNTDQPQLSRSLQLPSSPNMRHSFDIRDISWADYDDEYDDNPEELMETLEFLKQRDQLQKESKLYLNNKRYNNGNDVFDESSDEELENDEFVDSKAVDILDNSKMKRNSSIVKKPRKNEKSNNYIVATGNLPDHQSASNYRRISNKQNSKKRPNSTDNARNNNNYNNGMESHKTFEKPYKTSNFEGLKKMLESINVQ